VALASECWSTAFARVFYTDNVNFQPTEGSASRVRSRRAKTRSELIPIVNLRARRDGLLVALDLFGFRSALTVGDRPR